MLRISGILVLVSLACACSGINKAIVKVDGTATGAITFTQTADGVTIEGEIKGLTPGKHGFHVHSLGDITKGCDSTGSHFNPYGKNHGAPNATERHVGDLGNIEADQNGVAKVQMTDKIISLHGATNIIGRAIVVHSGVDDLGLGGNPDSLKTGNAGSRIGCGVIGILEQTSGGGRLNPAVAGLFGILSAVLLLSNKIFML